LLGNARRQVARFDTEHFEAGRASSRKFPGKRLAACGSDLAGFGKLHSGVTRSELEPSVADVARLV